MAKKIAKKDESFLTQSQFFDDMAIIKSLFRRALRQLRKMNQKRGRVFGHAEVRIKKLEKTR